MTALLLLFAGSGCAALIYEVVWFQLLQLVIGSSAISLAVLLSVYMGGLCLGSLALQRMEAARPVRHHPIQVYAFLEFGIGVLGILVLFAIPIVGRMYIAGATQGVIGVFLRGVVSALCLLPPTVLMGATLPALNRSKIRITQNIGSLCLSHPREPFSNGEKKRKSFRRRQQRRNFHMARAYTTFRHCTRLSFQSTLFARTLTLRRDGNSSTNRQAVACVALVRSFEP